MSRPIHISHRLGLDKTGRAVCGTETAVCIRCGQPATAVAVSGARHSTGELTSQQTTRSETVVEYACTKHAETVSNEMCDRYGHAANWYEPDGLAEAVSPRPPESRTGAALSWLAARIDQLAKRIPA